MECGALKSMGLKLPKTVEKLKRKYMKSLGPLTEVQWQFVLKDMDQIAWDPRLAYSQHRFKEEWLLQRLNRFKREGIKTWSRPVYEHYEDMQEEQRKDQIAYEYE